jgi:NAD-dependent deacetylase
MSDPSRDIEEIVLMFRRSQRAIAFTGAGISTPSGIPDFRSPHSGLWTNVDPLAVASIYGFRQNPESFYRWVYPLVHVCHEAQPNPAHYALARLEAMGKLRALITQNIDMLHTKAGSRVIHELHGHMREATCIHCFTVYDAVPIMEKFLEDRVIPLCEKCGSVLKPNVILFGEQLPFRVFQAAQDVARRADLMLVVGSSLEVAPASDLPLLAMRNSAKLVIINLDPTHLDSVAAAVIHADAAEVLPLIVDCLEKTS